MAMVVEVGVEKIGHSFHGNGCKLGLFILDLDFIFIFLSLL